MTADSEIMKLDGPDAHAPQRKDNRRGRSPRSVENGPSPITASQIMNPVSK